MTKSKSSKTEKKKLQFLVLHGPNLNLLGEREPEIYGELTLPEINKNLKSFAKILKVELKIHQSNHEGKLIDFLHDARKWADAVLMNPGAYTHYSYAIRDAIAAIEIPVAEVHLSDIHKREDFRKISVVEPVTALQVMGLGWKSYTKAMEMLVAHLARLKENKNGG